MLSSTNPITFDTLKQNKKENLIKTMKKTEEKGGKGKEKDKKKTNNFSQ